MIKYAHVYGMRFSAREREKKWVLRNIRQDLQRLSSKKALSAFVHPQGRDRFYITFGSFIVALPFLLASQHGYLSLGDSSTHSLII
jgi:hypothetical protein